MYWIDVLSRVQLMAFLFFIAGMISVLPIIGVFLDGGNFDKRFLTKMILISICLFTMAALTAFFAPSDEYIEFLKGGICE